MRILKSALCLLAAGTAFPALAEQQSAGAEAERPARARGPGTALEFTSGAEYQQGEFGTGERIETLSVNNVVRVQSGRVTFVASVPWHRIEAPGNVVGGGGIGLLGIPIIIDPTQPATREVREGLGDMRVGAGYTLPSLGGVDLTLTGQVKLPTGSRERGLGTGEADFAVGAEASRTIGAVTPFVSVAYTMPGDPAGYDLRNSLSARGGVAAQLAPRLRGSVSYGYAQSLSPLVEDEQLVSTALSAGLSRRVTLGVYGNAGLSDGAPDVGGGVSLGFRMF